MTFTKITAAGIGTTESVTLDGLSVINNGSFGGNLTVGGVLTYEDVTNVDSVGLITARNGIVVGSGITLSKDGDVFFTGIATGNGSGLTALNASNLGSGTVPTARLGSGTASSSTFLRGDSTFAAVTGFYGRTGNAALISTDDISVQNISAGIATFNTIAVGGTVSIGGTLTYEDVTNIDSVGLVTARNGIVVGSGITLSKDGDGFFTGIVTATTFSGALSGSGANITAINASNISSGTVPTARLGSGTASSSTFLRGDSTFQTVNTDLVSDTSPQLGGNLDVNSKTINLGDSSGETVNRIRLGADNDGDLFHDGTDLLLREVDSGQILLRSDGQKVFANASGSENQAIFKANGAVDLYYDNSKKFETTSTGAQIESQLTVYGAAGNAGRILIAEGGAYSEIRTTRNSDDNGDLRFYTEISGSRALRMKLDYSGHLTPATNNTYDLGTSSLRWRNIYTTDLQLSNEGKTNDVDGTWGDYTIQEGESDLFLINNRSGKKYKFNLTEVS